VCPVCGFGALDEPPYDDSGSPTYEICPCCGTEFGYGDATEAHATLRKAWIEKGTPWSSGSVGPPSGWDPQGQLHKLIVA
jgi:hypothetical protein